MQLDHSLKKQVHNNCLDLIADKIKIVDNNLSELMHAKTSETKSSAGDKYETGMAMIQNQEEQYKTQRAQYYEQQASLKLIDVEVNHKLIKHGSLVRTTAGIFYLSAALGKIETDEMMVFAVSMESPIAKALTGRQIDEHYVVNGVKNRILSVI